ncbi:PucR family transcriptional regulator [Pseudonocardia ailaonensis]|uniref:PucR family transcriptional regulator n=1 Tax=Pseudonocardia ailaonensis TaxID=367279 RepID=A0ABN2NAL7_9PSEU
MRLTLREVLELPSVARGRPMVRSGATRLDTDIRWAHVSELADLAGTLSGGELVLSVGVVLSDPAVDLGDYIESLRRCGAAALMIELGRNVERLPEALVQAARRTRFPVVELREPVRFVEITESVHSRVLHDRYEQVALSHKAHRVLGPLGIEGAPVEEILRRAGDLLGRPVVLEDLAHRVIAFAGDAPVEDVLRDWGSRSRQVPSGSDGSWGGPERWVSAAVGPRRRRWGRLVVPTRIDSAALDDVQIVLAQAAEAVTVAHLITGTGAGLDGMAASRLLQDVLEARITDDVTIRARALALSFSTEGPIAVVVARGFGRTGDGEGDLLGAVTRAAKAVGGTCLVGRIGPQLVGVLLDEGALSSTEDAATALSGALGPGIVTVLALKPAVPSWAELPAALTEAEYVARLAPGTDPGAPAHVVRVRDLGVRGLLGRISEDPALHTFIETCLGPLLALPEERRTAELATLESYLRSGTVMADFARRVHLSRAAAYARLKRLETLLDIDLADPEVRTGIHVALLGYQLQRPPTSPRGRTS